MSSQKAGQKERELHGVVGFFDDDLEILKATVIVRDKNYKLFDCFTPYPVHGLEAAQGLRRSWIPYVTFTMALVGFMFAFFLQYWTSVISWPLNVGGKPFNSWPAFVPILFELTILFSGVSTVVALILACRLPQMKNKAFDPAITNNRFAIFIERPVYEGADLTKKENLEKGFTKFNEGEAEKLLESVGAKEVRKIYQEGWF